MKVLVIGSGPIVIGQAAEFDYAGTQACKSLKEEGHEVVLINSNPATIMTDPGVADRLYIEPLNVDFCERVIARERPDALLPTLGGQTGLNLATQLHDDGVLEKYHVKLLGTPLSAIRKAEDREQFRDLMREIQEPVPESWIIESPDQLEAVLDVVPYPCIIRPAYTLGGTGGGIAHTRDELWEIGQKGLKLSMRSQIMVERSLLGWKEIEYEVMRDRIGTCITVCNMENFDPMGVHTGDSIVVAPSQTLSDLEYHMMRTASLKIINALGIEGGCNVQMALNPESFDYYIIEVNPRVSRSSALASKATGYPIARVAAKIAVGLTLDEIDNQVTGTTKACFEPALDYCVVKIPRWPFDKFASGDRSLFTQMKATGEVMAIDRSFEAAFMKAIRGLEVKQKDLRHPKFQGGVAGESLPRSLGKEVGGTWRGRLAPEPPTSFIDPDLDIDRRQGKYLPHWAQSGATYAVTFRLEDSLPAERRSEIESERALLAELRSQDLPISDRRLQEAEELYSHKMEKLLATGYGRCVLRDPSRATIVAEAIAHFDGSRYQTYAWCVMPNHVHVVLRPEPGHQLEEIVHSWKSFTSKAINKSPEQSGTVWLEEYYDHLVRDEADFLRQISYVQRNPGAAGISDHAFVWPPEVEDAASTGAGRPRHGLAASSPMPDAALRDAIRKPTDERLWAIAEGLRRGWGVDEVNRLSRVDKWFLRKIQSLLTMEQRLLKAKKELAKGEQVGALVADAFLLGFPSATIQDLLVGKDLMDAHDKAAVHMRETGEVPPEPLLLEAALAHSTASQVAFDKDQTPSASGPARWEAFGTYAWQALHEIERQKVMPVFKMVDTCAGEFESRTPYYYGTFEQEDDALSGIRQQATGNS